MNQKKFLCKLKDFSFNQHSATTHYLLIFFHWAQIIFFISLHPQLQNIYNLWFLPTSMIPSWHNLLTFFRQIRMDEYYSQNFCDQLCTKQESRACNQQTCPINCQLGDFGPWSECDPCIKKQVSRKCIIWIKCKKLCLRDLVSDIQLYGNWSAKWQFKLTREIGY